jgi:hypothetical protein
MKTNNHTLEEKLEQQISITQELVEEIIVLEAELESRQTIVNGSVNGGEKEELKIVIVDNILVAVGSNGFTVIDLNNGNASMYYATESNPAVVSVWNEDVERSTIFSEELVLNFDNDNNAKDMYRIITGKMGGK